LLARLEGANARRAHRVVTTSQYCRKRISFHYHVPLERISIVPEGIDVADWRSSLAAAPPKPDHHPTILCVARQYPRKHVADLVQAFALLLKYVPHARLRIVGDGPEHAALVTLAQSVGVATSTTFLGGIEDHEVRHEFAHCDVFCLPSVQEGFGIVFLEAMVAGKPVVSTTAAAIPEIVQHGKTGILVPPGDVRSLAGALLLLLNDDQRREQYGSTALEIVQRYDWARVAETFLKVVEQFHKS
jgi:glycosyltransferase involved in cell wall biosynthesis